MSKLEVIDLDELVEPVARVKVRGKEYDVLPISGTAFGLVAQVREKGKDATPGEQLEVVRAIIADAVPSMPEAVRNLLGLKQLTKLLAISAGKVDKVNRVLGAHDAKNGRRPARGAQKTRGR